MNELKLIAKLQHTNLVKLLGCCIAEEELIILIYEYMPTRSLDKFFHSSSFVQSDPSENTRLDWSKHFQIIEGIAQGVLYIHKHSRLKIIHRDLKASNVLLDGEMNPKISDFEMAKIFDMNQIKANTNRVVGTKYVFVAHDFNHLYIMKSLIFLISLPLIHVAVTCLMSMHVMAISLRNWMCSAVGDYKWKKQWYFPSC
ncbi:putative protein kinase RLK-Pelle-DLSV family [Rosa chinensis]|uniref:non-specific serine/threonine protein kinase n=1 Tax=Rosa chinensis TaxID=74649 RepID=A0A2P6QJ75_ROSCH|nr:putative protein kinase RLK-Pelle-DLSV family [Rosa chinensis]